MPTRNIHEFELDTKPLKKTSKQKFSDFFYNEESGAIMGRTPESWG